MLDKNEIKKDLYRTKAIAKLMYYDPANGDLMYTFNALGKDWVFPIHTLEPKIDTRYEMTDTGVIKVEISHYILTQDLKGARFEPEMRGSSLIRWIEQAIEKNELH